ncbi:MAG: hypothetical protein JXL97_16060 [Bacteroidales bacterium]|nr:hypothetical protein [Bacteroidales bacterium]
MKDKSSIIFGNKIKKSIVKSADKQKKKYLKKFGDDSNVEYFFKTEENKILIPFINLDDLKLSENYSKPLPEKSVIIGNIRMGYGHYRISIAIASCANSMGYKPLWLDLNSFENTTTSKIIGHLNKLYSLGSRLSQKYKIFNKLYWEPLNSEGFRKIEYNAKDQKMTEIMSGLHKNLPKNIPYIATHVWPAQAAVHAGFNKVVNVIPDNWQMALHLAEGSIHATQGFSAFLGYRTLRGMNKNNVLNPIPKKDIELTGHYIDHELVANLEEDTAKRLDRITNEKPLRILITVGGAGAQQEIVLEMINFLEPYIKSKKAAILLNIGDHKSFWEYLKTKKPDLESTSNLFFNDWQKTVDFAEKALNEDIIGINIIQNGDIFEAIYTTNLLMRSADIMITKPSELAFYPVPKLLIKRVGGHEAWGAIRSAEIGDGTVEANETNYALQLLKLMIEEKDILTLMNNKILENNKIGIYNGGYNVIKLAVE